MRATDADRSVEKPRSLLGSSGQNLRGNGSGASNRTARQGTSNPKEAQLMEAVLERENLIKALERVERNKGSAGIDGMAANQLRTHLQEHWSKIKEELLGERYQPQAVRRVEIPKADGKGKRPLGIPTVLDRWLQQALQQALSPIFEPGFSAHSYGFRPGRSALQAVKAVQRYAAEGRRWVVDLDLEKFFDQVNHDGLMARVARKVKDKRVLRLIRRYLQSGILVGGLVEPNVKGVPQGSPLSPLLSNIVLDDLDQELERRGHAFCRYADDCNVYVRSRKAGERVMASLKRFVERRLHLRVNEEKSAVDRPWKRKFLGYSMTWHKQPRLKAAARSIQRLKGKLKALCRQGRGRNLQRFIREDLNPVLVGWMNYFRLCQVKGIFQELDGWLRRRLRCIRWRQWKRPRTRVKKLRQRGLSERRAQQSAYNGRGPWWNAGASHMNEAFPKRYFDRLGLVSLLERLHQLQ